MLEAARKLGVPEQTVYHWKQRYGGTDLMSSVISHGSIAGAEHSAGARKSNRVVCS